MDITMETVIPNNLSPETIVLVLELDHKTDGYALPRCEVYNQPSLAIKIMGTEGYAREAPA